MKKILVLFLFLGLSKIYGQSDTITYSLPDYSSKSLRAEAKKLMMGKTPVYIAQTDSHLFTALFQNNSSITPKIWLRINAKPKKVKNKKGKWIETKTNEYELWLTEIDCYERRFKIIQYITYNEKGELIDSFEDSIAEFKYIVPNTVYDILHSIVCDNDL